MRRIVLLYPSIRPDHVEPAVKRAECGLRGDAVIVWSAVVNCESAALCEMHAPDCVEWLGPRMPHSNLVTATNHALSLVLRKLSDRSEPLADHEIVGFWSDDFFPEPDWSGALLDAAEQFPDADYFAAQDDCFDHAVDDLDYPACVPFARWRWIRDSNGGEFWPSCYSRWACDNDNAMRARLARKLLYVDTCRIVHHNPTPSAKVQRARDDADEYGADRVAPDRVTWARRQVEILDGNLIWRPERVKS